MFAWCRSNVLLHFSSTRVKTAVQSNGGSKIPLSYDYVILAENAGTTSDIIVPIAELNDATLTTRSDMI